jgi:V/A-type H+-transporting ATPase subunit E
MEKKIQELTDKIYQEGVRKGEEKAKEILAGAHEQARKTVASAQAEAEKIMEEARQKAQEFRQKIESEVRLCSTQAIGAVKERIMDVLTTKALDEPVTEAMKHPDTIKSMVAVIAQKWKEAEGDDAEIEVLLPEDKRAELEKAFKGRLLDNMSKGLRLQFSKSLKGGFQIGPKGSSFKVSLTDEDFMEFFRQYLRPQTKAFLFGE